MHKASVGRGVAQPTSQAGRASSSSALPLQLNKKCDDDDEDVQDDDVASAIATCAVSLRRLCAWAGERESRGEGALCRTTSCVSIRYKLAPCAVAGRGRGGEQAKGLAQPAIFMAAALSCLPTTSRVRPDLPSPLPTPNPIPICLHASSLGLPG